MLFRVKIWCLMLSWTSYSSKSDVIKCKKDIKNVFLAKCFSTLLKKKTRVPLQLRRTHWSINCDLRVLQNIICFVDKLVNQKVLMKTWVPWRYSFFPTKPSATPRQGTGLTKPDSRPQIEGALHWVPVQQVEPSCTGLMSVSFATLCRFY